MELLAAVIVTALANGKRKHWSKGNCGDFIWWTYVWQSGSSTGPSKEKLFERSFWDVNFEVTKSPKLEGN